MTSSPRALAARVLLRVEQEQSFAAAALSSAIEADRNVSDADRALATELTYGVLRVRLGLLAELGRLLDRSAPEALDPLVRVHLLLALYQIVFLDRVPAFAATHEAVKLVTEARNAKLGGLVNAVLRRYLREAEQRGAIGREQAVARIGWASMPEWLRAALTASLGKADARAFATDALAIPPTCVAVIDPAERQRWTGEMPGATSSPWSPYGVRISGSARLHERADFGQRFYVQEEGSQALACALGVTPGMRVLDACAGRGQKTALLAQQLGAHGELWATDLYPAKLSELGARLQALGLPAPRTAAVDWSRGAGALEGTFDAILVDAPCTGIGTLRRRPDLLLRRAPEDLERLPVLQRDILRNALTRLAPGGRLLYAVCSVLDAEGPAVIDAVCTDHQDLTVTACARLTPMLHGTDGYFYGLIERRA